MPDSERDSFKHLLLLCLPHHAEVDDRRTGEKLYPAETLLQWKRSHEGDNNAVLNSIGPVNEDALMNEIASIFEPPLQRLEIITQQLEKTGTLNAQSVADLRGVLSVLAESPTGPDARAVQKLVDAVDQLGGENFPRTVNKLADAADTMMKAARRMPER
ncbi:hypothetical protein [Micromonospora saelicesensis]|uniref:hypothetical protein n=1 Tax=Micromonospora saelicesensis TaxID=285676 RepID=UPI0011BD6EA9|nr:hypothetical protein [Micromonospora saelicesensis]